jgi:2-polyprenyl-6-hydroxyphenyl methylase/3-demethylubiquinone-9 3-methyltransferase
MKKHFNFGKNWKNFVALIDDKRIRRAENSLKEMLKVADLKGKSFLDIGCGSGIFSLAAANLGATRVHSFDYDPDSVEAAKTVKDMHKKNSTGWTIERGDVLDPHYLEKLGKFDIVYSWGVLHHTGDMWKAFENLLANTSADGKVYISIYNDQGRKSRTWKSVKKLYNTMPGPLKYSILIPGFVRIWGPTTVRDLVTLKPFKSWNNYREDRGMSPWHDVVDWIGGWPFEVAKPEEIFDFFRKRGFELTSLKTCGGGYGTNEFVFRRKPCAE